MKNIISISEARSKIFEIAEKVQKTSQVFTLTENGRPKVVIISAEEYENIIEDLGIMRNNKFMSKVENAATEFIRGEYLLWENIKKELLSDKKSLVLSDKSNIKYKNSKKSEISNKKNVKNK